MLKQIIGAITLFVATWATAQIPVGTGTNTSNIVFQFSDDTQYWFEYNHADSATLEDFMLDLDGFSSPSVDLNMPDFGFGLYLDGATIGNSTNSGFGGGELYWHLWTGGLGDTPSWLTAEVGMSDITLENGSWSGWVYGNAEVPDPLPATPEPPEPKVDFWLTVLHSNDADSRLLDNGVDPNFGGADRFVAQVRRLRTLASTGNAVTQSAPRASVLLSAGSTVAASFEFHLSVEQPRLLESTLLSLAGFDAVAFGTSDFDFTPSTTARLVQGVRPLSTKFLACNLGYADEPELLDLKRKGRIAASTVLTREGRKIGVIGVIRPDLPHFTASRSTSVKKNIRKAVQTQIDNLKANGVPRIILLSHLGSWADTRGLVAGVRGVDIAISGGGAEVLANSDSLLIPGDTAEGAYPNYVKDLAGRKVAVVSTGGKYAYVGRLVVGFDAKGEILQVHEKGSGPVRVVGGTYPDAIAGASDVKTSVLKVLQDAVDASNVVVATAEVRLDGRTPSVRTQETNLGNLVADAMLNQARKLAPDFDAASPQLAIVNSGGIRVGDLMRIGSINQIELLTILPLPSLLTVVEGVSPNRLKSLLENAVSKVALVDGRFPQIAGFKFTYDKRQTAQVTAFNGEVTTPGNRIRSVRLNNGTWLVRDGRVVEGAPNITLATIGFLAQGGDQYPLAALKSTALGITNQEALKRFIKGKVIQAADYPASGQGRINVVP